MDGRFSGRYDDQKHPHKHKTTTSLEAGCGRVVGDLVAEGKGVYRNQARKSQSSIASIFLRTFLSPPSSLRLFLHKPFLPSSISSTIFHMTTTHSVADLTGKDPSIVPLSLQRIAQASEEGERIWIGRRMLPSSLQKKRKCITYAHQVLMYFAFRRRPSISLVTSGRHSAFTFAYEVTRGAGTGNRPARCGFSAGHLSLLCVSSRNGCLAAMNGCTSCFASNNHRYVGVIWFACT